MPKRESKSLDELDKKMKPEVLRQAKENAKLADILEKSKRGNIDLAKGSPKNK